MKRESPQKIERARYTLYYDELVVLKNIGDRAHLDEKMVQDADYVSSLGENSLYNYAKMPPPTPSLTKETSKKIPLGPKTSSETLPKPPCSGWRRPLMTWQSKSGPHSSSPSPGDIALRPNGTEINAIPTGPFRRPLPLSSNSLCGRHQRPDHYHDSRNGTTRVMSATIHFVVSQSNEITV